MRIAGRMVKGRQFPQFTGQVLERDRQLVCALPVGSQHVDARTGGLLISRFLFLASSATAASCSATAIPACKQVARRGRAGNAVTLGFCWAHWRGRFYEIAKAGSRSPRRCCGGSLSLTRSKRRSAAGAPRRVSRCARPKASRSVAALKAWLQVQFARASAKSAIAIAIRYGVNHWEGLERFAPGIPEVQVAG